MLILIAGITGSMGTLLTYESLKRGHTMRGLGRDASRLSSDLKDKIEFVEYKNYHDEEALDRACLGCDAVICAYAMQSELQLEGQLFLLRAADRAGVKKFVADSWNGDYRTMSLGFQESYDPYIAFRAQSQLESKIKPIYMLTGCFAEVLLGTYHTNLESNPWKLEKGELRIWGTGNETMAASPMPDAAGWTIRVLEREDAEEGGDWFVYSFRTSYRELAKVYGDVTGNHIEIITEGSLEELSKVERRERAAGDKTQFWEYLGWTYLKNMLGGVFDSATDEHNAEFPPESRTSIEDFVKQQLRMQKS